MDRDAVAADALRALDAAPAGSAVVCIPGLVNRLAARFFASPVARRTWRWMTSPSNTRVTVRGWLDDQRARL